jgi:hypothetical protein
MRDFIRASFSMLMFIFLLVGCVHNIYHFQAIDNHRMKNYPNYRRYSPSRTNTYYDRDAELEEIVSDDSQDQALNNEEDSVSGNYRRDYYGY